MIANKLFMWPLQCVQDWRFILFFFFRLHPPTPCQKRSAKDVWRKWFSTTEWLRKSPKLRRNLKRCEKRRCCYANSWTDTTQSKLPSSNSNYNNNRTRAVPFLPPEEAAEAVEPTAQAQPVQGEEFVTTFRIYLYISCTPAHSRSSTVAPTSTAAAAAPAGSTSRPSSTISPNLNRRITRYALRIHRQLNNDVNNYENMSSSSDSNNSEDDSESDDGNWKKTEHRSEKLAHDNNDFLLKFLV